MAERDGQARTSLLIPDTFAQNIISPSGLRLTFEVDADRVRPSAYLEGPGQSFEAPSRCGPVPGCTAISPAPTDHPRDPPTRKPRLARISSCRDRLSRSRNTFRRERPRRRDRLVAEILQHHSGAEEFGRGIGDVGGISVAEGEFGEHPAWVRRAKSMASYCSATCAIHVR